MIVKDLPINKLRQYIEKNCGILVEPDKNYLIETRLARLLAQTQSKDFEEFYKKVTTENNIQLREQIIDAITTNETFWFRDTRMWTTFEKLIIPQYLEKLKKGSQSKVRIWSAASSTGQEAYSLAMLIDRIINSNLTYKNISPSQFEIIGTDISSSALFLANSARYSRIEIRRGLPDYYLNKYFKPAGINKNIHALDESIKKRVTFKKFNLQDDIRNLGRFDIILCRNVIIYFSNELKKTIFGRISQMVNPSGYCLLGASESLNDYSDKFTTTRDESGAIYYQLKP